MTDSYVQEVFPENSKDRNKGKPDNMNEQSIIMKIDLKLLNDGKLLKNTSEMRLKIRPHKELMITIALQAAG